MRKTGYREKLAYVSDIEVDEKYALLSHSIQLADSPEAKKYNDILIENGIDLRSLPSVKDFNKVNNVVLTTKRKDKFTFIDLFA